MKKILVFVLLALLVSCAQNPTSARLYYRVPVLVFEQILIRDPYDTRIDINATYICFDSYSGYQKGDKYVYYPTTEFKLIDGIMYRNSAYPFRVKGNSWRYIIKYDDIKEYIWTEGEEM